jgi:predicted O-methyltransferase YrrM
MGTQCLDQGAYVNLERAIDIEGFMHPPELQWLARQAAKAKTIVEIGSWMGRSTRALGDNVVLGGVVFAVDHWAGAKGYYTQLTIKKLGGPDVLYQKFRRNTADLIKDGTVVPIRSASQDAMAKLTKKLGNWEVDLVFVDGDHSYSACMRDITDYLPLVRRGGVMAGHDYDQHGVVRAVKELFKKQAIRVVPGTRIWYVTIRAGVMIL